ncbi:MAG: hypothetical protein KA138_12505 [Saprospiraceae bacterium]|nr:hypothetical protein [Saprospiraceae bacterium]
MKPKIKFILFIIMVSGFGCKNNKNDYPISPMNAVAGSYIIETKPFKIGAETYKGDFGTITVQENRSQSTSRLINIPFLRIHSTTKYRAEPIFGLAGGPGQSNMKWAWDFAGTFLSKRDFVLAGYRGFDLVI